MSTPKTPKFVAYYRVSTKTQGISGLGLDAQREKVHAVIRASKGEIVGEFTEIASGTSKSIFFRDELQKALKLARELGAVLVVAKLDRLARDAAFVLGLKDAGVDFLACDFPGCNRLVMTIMASIAEYEATLISERTKAGLQAARARGTKLGGYRGAPLNQPEAMDRMRQARTDTAARRRAPMMDSVQAALDFAGGRLSEACDMLNASKTPTVKGKNARWHPSTLANFIKRGELVLPVTARSET